MNLGRAIRECREARGMTQEQVAAAMPDGTDAEGVAYFEGHAEWHIRGMVHDFAQALRIPASIILTLAADESELAGVNSTLAAKFRQVTLDLMRPEEGK